MAENKKSFVLYTDLIKSIEHLTNEEKGILFNHLLEYVNDMNPVLTDRLLLTAWKPIETQLKRDLIKFEETKENRSLNGRLGNLKRWNYDLYLQVIDNKIDINKAESIANNRKLSPPDSSLSQTVANVAVNVNDNVSVNDNVINKNNIDDRKLKFASTLEPFLSIYGKDLLNDFYKYWTEPNKSNTKFKQELEKTWSLERRLETWCKNESNFRKTSNTNSDHNLENQFTNRKRLA